jgi:protein-L-isoaspartate(D-aspartate) O-methyltransferase
MRTLSFLWVVIVVFIGCSEMSKKESTKNKVNFTEARTVMVKNQIEFRGISNERVLSAMRKVPRHLFVPDRLQNQAYNDEPLPIGHGQTISQPYIVAYMTEQLDLDGDELVLEIGTGSGYQAAVLAELSREVYSIEIVTELGENAKKILAQLGYKNVHIKIGDGYQGWVKYAPFDAIIVPIENWW